jgi:uncharacterized membrane protein YtjA (UPF0391 family)
LNQFFCILICYIIYSCLRLLYADFGYYLLQNKAVFRHLATDFVSQRLRHRAAWSDTKSATALITQWPPRRDTGMYTTLKVFGAGQPRGIAAPHRRIFIMLHYAVVFFVIALIAAVFGFGGIAAGAMEIGKILFVVFAVLAVASFLVSLVKRS